jgi:hypothetical protein
MFDLQAQVADLEARIEELFLAAERCRKIEVIAKTLIAAGCVLFLATISGALPLGPTALLLGLAAVLGGLALLGSNRRTLDDTIKSIRTHEARRAKLIDALALQTVNVRTTGGTSSQNTQKSAPERG